MRDSQQWVRREPTVFASLLLLSTALFIFTFFLTKAFHRQQTRIAEHFYSAGQSALAASNASAAIDDFHTALRYEPANDAYRFRLAQSLALAGRDKEALSHLQTLWERAPGDGELNLELARLSVRMGESHAASQYFHSAIYGVWPDSPYDRRRDARLELSQFLLGEKKFSQADSELIALAATLPPDPASHLQIAELFQRAGDHRNALKEFQFVLAHQHDNVAALVGAGRSSFELRLYDTASSFLQAAARKQPLAPDALQALNTSKLIIESDPFRRGISTRERALRASAAFDSAGQRLQQCAASKQIDLQSSVNNNALASGYQRWTATRPLASPSALRREPDNIDPVMNLVFDLESDSNDVCGTATGKDLALTLLARSRSGGER